MVSKNEIIKQLKKINFDHKGWGRSEAAELQNVIIPGEEIYECVNGMYEGGFALLVATDIRLLLIDKKPLNFLTIEDMRFDTINEMDYNHRLFGADIGISAGSKNLRFRSYNQQKLRKLIGHVQHCMAEGKQKQSTHQDTQVSHLEQINLQLQSYLSAQHQYQQQLQQINDKAQSDASSKSLASVPEPPKPSNELADYLYAQSLLAQHEDSLKTETSTEEPNKAEEEVKSEAKQAEPAKVQEEKAPEPVAVSETKPANPQADQYKEMYEEGMREIYNMPKTQSESAQSVAQEAPQASQTAFQAEPNSSSTEMNPSKKFEVSPMQIAYSKLPMALRNRKFGKPRIAPQVTPVVSQPTTITNS
jgi:hypothetical protein